MRVPFKILQVAFVVLFQTVDARCTGNKGLVLDVLVVSLGAEKLFSHLSRAFAQYRNDNEVENVFFKQIRVGVQLANQFVAPAALGPTKTVTWLLPLPTEMWLTFSILKPRRARSM